MPLLILSGLAALLVAWFLWQPRLQQHRRRRWQAQPFPAAWRPLIARRVPLVRTLPAPLRTVLEQRIQVFLAEKAFIGCAGQPITDEVRVTIAAQACLLLLNRPADNYPELRQILVYPSPFEVQHVHQDEIGVVQSRRDTLAGESWEHGQVILAWDEVLESAASPDDGYNVVLHEFAHQLDAEDGVVNGAPALGSAARYARWASVMQEAYAELQAQVDRDEPTLLDPYGATDPVEFFAVATEVFFEQASTLAAAHPALYQQLVEFYRLDPATWSRPAAPQGEA